jgi:hypothetical protein
VNDSMKFVKADAVFTRDLQYEDERDPELCTTWIQTDDSTPIVVVSIIDMFGKECAVFLTIESAVAFGIAFVDVSQTALNYRIRSDCEGGVQ